MQRILFVDRMDPQHAEAVARIWAAHDNTRLPRVIGVTGRTLFHFRGLYLHFVESADDSDVDLADRIFTARTNPAYLEVRDKLGKFLIPYSADCRRLRDTRAEEFYRWSARGTD
jgi:hypothetical protein